jgi:hypothetical protein
MRPYATSVGSLTLLGVRGHQLIGYGALCYKCMRPEATSVSGLKLLVYEALSYECIGREGPAKPHLFVLTRIAVVGNHCRHLPQGSSKASSKQQQLVKLVAKLVDASIRSGE